MTFEEGFHRVTVVIAAASFVANILPKSSVFEPYPRIKRAYETFINFVAGTALNLRFRLPSLDISAPPLGLSKPPDSQPQPSKEEILKQIEGPKP
jgi:hypothetical protein